MKALRFVLVCWAAAFLAACSSTPKFTGLNPSRYTRTIRVACVGDSITYGSGIADRAHDSYPAELDRMLGDKFDVRNFGVSGATLLRHGDKPYWNQPEFAAVGDDAPDVVIIMLGTNDSKPQNWRYGEEFERDLTDMVEHFRQLPSEPYVWLCLPVPVFAPRWGINEPVVADEVIPIIKKVADARRVPVIDLHAALSGKGELFPDHIHPNAEGAQLMARTIHDALLFQP